jgi:hypothetical protein
MFWCPSKIFYTISLEKQKPINFPSRKNPWFTEKEFEESLAMTQAPKRWSKLPTMMLFLFCSYVDIIRAGALSFSLLWTNRAKKSKKLFSHTEQGNKNIFSSSGSVNKDTSWRVFIKSSKFLREESNQCSKENLCEKKRISIELRRQKKFHNNDLKKSPSKKVQINRHGACLRVVLSRSDILIHQCNFWARSCDTKAVSFSWCEWRRSEASELRRRNIWANDRVT